MLRKKQIASYINANFGKSPLEGGSDQRDSRADNPNLYGGDIWRGTYTGNDLYVAARRCGIGRKLLLSGSKVFAPDRRADEKRQRILCDRRDL